MLDLYTACLKEQPTLKDLPLGRLSDVVQEAVKWGLLSPDPDYPRSLRLQPVLPYFLRNHSSSQEQLLQRMAIEKAFQDYYRDISQALDDFITSKRAKEQRIGLLATQFEYENLLTALRFALREKTSVIDLYAVLSHYLDRQQDYQHGQELDSLVLVYFETLSPGELIYETAHHLALFAWIACFVMISHRGASGR